MKFKKLNQSAMSQMFRPKGALYEINTLGMNSHPAEEAVKIIIDKLEGAFGLGFYFELIEEVVPQQPKMQDYEVSENTWYWSINDDRRYPELYLTTDEQLTYLIMSVSNITLEQEIVG